MKAKVKAEHERCFEAQVLWIRLVCPRCGSLRSARPCDGVEVFRLVREIVIRRNEADELGRELGRLVRVLTLVHPRESKQSFSSIHERVEVAVGRVDSCLGVEELPAVAVEGVPWRARPSHDEEGDADSEQGLPHRSTPEGDIGVRAARLKCREAAPSAPQPAHLRLERVRRDRVFAPSRESGESAFFSDPCPRVPLAGAREKNPRAGNRCAVG